MNSVRIDLGLSRYSDMAFTSAVVVLVVALLVLAVELARVRVRRVQPRAPAATVVAGDGRPGLVVEAPVRSWDERLGGAGLALVYLGAALLLACWCCVAWPRRECRGATCTSSSI